MEIIPNAGVCDPHIHIFEGKAYMFSTHDFGPWRDDFCMYDWQVFSSDDLLEWKKEFVLRPEDTFLKYNRDCFATDAAYRNGKYYMYFSDGQDCIGVAVSENGPGGPYRDALDKPLIPAGYVGTACYDPTVYIEDDENKTPYLIFGYTLGVCHYYIARLNEDMISLAEEPRPIELINGWEDDANWVTKHNGVYYLNTHHGQYATADNLYGPYTFRGVFSHDSYVDHATFFTYHNQFYVAYGVPYTQGKGREDTDWFYRTAKIVYAQYRDNGEIYVDTFSETAGVGQYDAAWDEIRAVWFFAASDGVLKKEQKDGTFALQGLRHNGYAAYPKIRNVPKNAVLTLRASNGNDVPCRVIVREGSPWGRVLGQGEMMPTGSFDTFADLTLHLNVSAGEHDLCLTFEAPDVAGEVIRPDSLRFAK